MGDVSAQFIRIAMKNEAIHTHLSGAFGIDGHIIHKETFFRLEMVSVQKTMINIGSGLFITHYG